MEFNVLDSALDTFTLLLIISASSFFGAFTKELNDKAKSPNTSFLLFISEILLNSISGIILGILFYKFINTDILILVAISSVSGMFGEGLVKFAINFGAFLLAKSKDLDIKEVKNFDIEEDENKKKAVRKRNNKKNEQK